MSGSNVNGRASHNGNGKAPKRDHRGRFIGRNGSASGKRAGPHTKWHEDDQFRVDILRGFETAASFGEVCRAAGVDPSTVKKWRRVFPAVHQAIAHARAVGRQRRIDLIEAHAAEDWRASAFLLACENPARYGKRQRIEHTGASGRTLGEELGNDDAWEALDRLGEAMAPLGAAEKPGGNSRVPL